jgi:Tol biopolymer transport system component
VVAKVLSVGIAIVALAAIALAVPAFRHLREGPSPPAPAIRVAFPAPAGAELGSGDQTLDAAIAPNEREIVFVATTSGTAALWRRALDSERADRIAGTDGAQFPAWKATGNAVSFFSGRRLKQLSTTDGVVRDLTAASTPLGASWLPDGSLLFADNPRGPIRRLRNGDVSDASTLQGGDRGHAFPVSAGDDGSFVYTATLNDGRRIVRLAQGGIERDLVTTTGHGQLVDGTLLHVRDGVLLGQRLHPETPQVSGRSVPLALSVGSDSNGRSYFTASRRVLLTAPGISRRYQLTWFPLTGGAGTPTREPGDYWQVRLSSDDRYAALTQTTPLVRTLDVALAPMSETGYNEPLTRAVAPDSDPVWSPDGRRLVFRSLQDGPPRLFTHIAHDQDAADVIVPMSAADETTSVDETPTDWRDGRIIVHGPGPKGDLDVWSVNADSGAREAIADTGFNETDGRLPHDGRWLAYVSDESGQPDVYALPQPRGPRVRVSFAGGTRPRWSRDGRAVFFLRGSQIMRADMSGTGFTTPRAVVEVPGVRDFDIAHRRDALIALVPASNPTTASVSAIIDWQMLIPAVQP